MWHYIALCYNYRNFSKPRLMRRVTHRIKYFNINNNRELRTGAEKPLTPSDAQGKP